MSNHESRSFITADGMRFVSAKDSGRNRERMHILPPDSPLTFSMYSSILNSVAQNSIPHRIFLRNEDHYEIIDPKQLRDLQALSLEQRKTELHAITDRMWWAEEIIVEQVCPEEILIQNLPQEVFEPIPIDADVLR